MCFALPGIGKVSGAQIGGKKDRGRFPIHQSAEGFGGQWLSLSLWRGEPKVHPQPLYVQCQTPGASGCCGCFSQMVGKAAAGNGGAEQRDGVLADTGIALRHVERSPCLQKGRTQRLGKCQTVLTGRRFKIQQHAGVISPSAFPQHCRTQGLRVIDERSGLIADG